MKFVPFHRLSTLAARRAQGDFHSAPETVWLVWEPGSWTPAHPTQEGTAPRDLKAAWDDALTADALVFELVPDAAPTRFVVGRSRTCEVLINDATVSRTHLSLSHSAKKWTVALAPGGKEASFNGAPLTTTPVALHSGLTLGIGSVQLTFLTRSAFEERLRREAGRKKAKR